MLKLAEDLLEIPAEILEDAINLELGDGMVVADTIGERQCVFMRKLWEAERSIAERLRSLRDGQPPWPTIEADKAIEWVQVKPRRHAGGKPAGGGPDSPDVQGRGHHRRTGGG